MADFPFTFETLDIKDFQDNLMKVMPGGYMVIECFKDILPQLYNLKLRSDDVWLIGLPKSGTTWATEMIWTVYEGDVRSAEEKPHLDRWSVAEMDGFIENFKKPELAKTVTNEATKELTTTNTIDKMNNYKSKRFIRSHLPLSLLPPKLLDTCKVFYIARDNRDCCVSMYHMVKGGVFQDCDTFYDLFKRFISDKVAYGPYPQSIKEAWNLRNHKNLMFIFYEEMIQDLPSVLQKTAKFLGREKLTEMQLKLLVRHLSLGSMKNNKNINMEAFKETGIGAESKFIRKGIIGDWQNYFTPKMAKEFQDWWDSYMKDSDFEFPKSAARS